MSEKKQKTDELAERISQLDAREKLLEEKERRLSKLEKQLAEKSPVVEEVIKPKGLSFTFREEKYKFSDDAPLKILFGGQVLTQKQLIEDEDALAILIGGNSNLIEKK